MMTKSFVTLLVVVTLLISSTGSLFAASGSGSIGSRSTAASLTRSTTSASGTTTSSPSDGNASHTVSILVTYYYTSSDGTAVKTTKSGNSVSAYTAAKTVTGSGKDVRTISASSTHKVTWSGVTWTKNLFA